MAPAEFLAWFKYHKGRFTGLRNWFDRMGTTDRSETEAAWAAAMRTVALDVAKAATDALFEGVEPDPKSYDKHPAAIRDFAFRERRVSGKVESRIQQLRKPQLIDGQAVHRCPNCKDTGMRIVWRSCCKEAAWSRTLRNPETGEGLHGPHSCAVPCPCDLGRAMQGPAADQAQYFDPRLMPLWTSGDSVQRYNDLQHWLESGRHEASADKSGVVEWEF